MNGSYQKIKMANIQKLKNVTIEDTVLIFRNFSGKPSEYNIAGDRNFGCLIAEEDAIAMSKDGWNIKQLRPKDEEEVPGYFIKISVSFRNVPPLIYVIHKSEDGSTRTVKLNEEDLNVLDYADIVKADLQLNPYFWSKGKESGVKAYLKSLYVTVPEDKLEARYLGLKDNDETY